MKPAKKTVKYDKMLKKQDTLKREERKNVKFKKV